MWPFKKKASSKPNRIYRTGDGWGNIIEFHKELRVSGFKGNRPRVGDYLISGTTGKLYRFVAVELVRDPSDMFWGDLELVGDPSYTN